MIRLLALMLILQAGLVAFLYWPQGDDRVVASLIPDIAFDAIDGIEITDAEGGSVALSLEEGAWTLESGLPVDATKVATLTDALARDPGLAIATSESAAERFKLSDDNFDRRIVLSAGGEESLAYLGLSPAFRKIHARAGGDSSIYTIELNNYDAPVDPGAWLDKTLLARRDVSSFELYDLRFTRDGERCSGMTAKASTKKRWTRCCRCSRDFAYRASLPKTTKKRAPPVRHCASCSETMRSASASWSSTTRTANAST